MNKKVKILAVVGGSGSGKTTMVEHWKKELGIPVVVSYTTRPIRKGETDGVEHKFVTENELPLRGEILAYTKFGGHHYWATFSLLPESGACSYVIDEKGLIELQANFSDRFEIIPILVKRNIESVEKIVDKHRIDRDKDRISIMESNYMAIIDANLPLDEFLANSIKTIQKLI